MLELEQLVQGHMLELGQLEHDKLGQHGQLELGHDIHPCGV